MKFLSPKDKTEAIRLYTRENKTIAKIAFALGYSKDIIERMLNAEGMLL